jgi:YggT family protein
MGFLIVLFLKGVFYLVIADAVLSWIQGPRDMPRRLTHQITEPIYRPLHQIINPRRTGGMDFSPIILIIVLQMLIRLFS